MVAALTPSAPVAINEASQVVGGRKKDERIILHSIKTWRHNLHSLLLRKRHSSSEYQPKSPGDMTITAGLPLSTSGALRQLLCFTSSRQKACFMKYKGEIYSRRIYNTSEVTRSEIPHLKGYLHHYLLCFKSKKNLRGLTKEEDQRSPVLTEWPSIVYLSCHDFSSTRLLTESLVRLSFWLLKSKVA